MLFNSVHFLLFFAVVFGVYWSLPHRFQNPWLLISSFFFYGYWDWRFLGLLLLSTTVDFCAALLIAKAHEAGQAGRAKALLWVSLAVNFGILISFKMFGLFDHLLSQHDSANRFGAVNYVVPIGISFYTFQAVSYVIDVYRRKIPATRQIQEFMLYVSFFPQLVAGPIERADQLIPQIQNKRTLNWDQAFDAIFIIIWGLFFKCVVADNLMPFVVSYFEQPMEVSTTITLLSSYAACFQVYCDFAGYTYIALGTAGLLGFRLSDNFRQPYFSKGPQEFWTRWHITLVDWFRNYVFHPLSRALTNYMPIPWAAGVALTMTMLAFAMWHGPSLTFLIWGFLQALVFFIYHFIHARAKRTGAKPLPAWLQAVIWFHVLLFTSIIYRSREVGDFGLHMANLFRGFKAEGAELALTLLWFVGPVLAVEAMHLKEKTPVFFKSRPWAFRALAAGFVYLAVVLCGAPASWSFIYFHF